MTENKQNYKTLIKRIFFPLSFIFPIVLSMGSCSDIGGLSACVAAIILSIFIDKYNEKSMLHILFGFSIISYLYSLFGYYAVIICLVISAITLCFGFLTSKVLRKFINSSIYAGLMLAMALVTTIIQTNNYFSIGANGNTAREIIESYVSLGFHGNWRGVLYGTIVMVILITFPRKFKRFSKIIHPAFFALMITVGLNFVLNPPDLISSITEIENLNPNINLNFSISLKGFFISVLCGLILGLSNTILFSKEDCNKADYIKCGILNICFSPLMCFIPQKISKDLFKNIPFAEILALIILIFKDIIIRIPVHSCAVILIVAAWQAIEWNRIKNAFKSPLSVLLFILPILIFIIF